MVFTKSKKTSLLISIFSWLILLFCILEKVIKVEGGQIGEDQVPQAGQVPEAGQEVTWTNPKGQIPETSLEGQLSSAVQSEVPPSGQEDQVEFVEGQQGQ